MLNLTTTNTPMKNINWNIRIAGLVIASSLFVLGTSCSSESGNQEAEETTTAAPAPEEEVSMEEEEPMEMEEDTAMAEEEEADAQVSRVQPEPVKKPENKEPVLTVMSTSYKDWNKDGNNVLDKEEFYGGLYEVWDQNDSGEIEEGEFGEGANKFFTDYNVKEYGDYAEWDSDGNGNISMAEFREGMKATVDQDPTAQDLLVIWDTDNDDAIERIELDNITVRLDEDNN